MGVPTEGMAPPEYKDVGVAPVIFQFETLQGLFGSSVPEAPDGTGPATAAADEMQSAAKAIKGTWTFMWDSCCKKLHICNTYAMAGNMKSFNDTASAHPLVAKSL
jgi:hypothetical protein